MQPPRTHPQDPAWAPPIVALALIVGVSSIAFGSWSLLAPVPPPRQARSAETARAAAPSPAPASTTPPRQLATTWQAVVAQGEGFAPGTPCTISATVAVSPASTGDAEVRVSCGDSVLYTSAQRVAGRETHSRITEEPGEREGLFRYAFDYKDRGEKTGTRPQIVIDSYARSATVWSDGGSSSTVRLAVAELSAAYEGDPFASAGAAVDVLFRTPADRIGTVESVGGSARVRLGDTCAVYVRPTLRTPGHDCRVYVRCGGEIVYGAGDAGFARCAAEAGQVVAAKDDGSSRDDRDPKLDLDLAREQAIVSDVVPAPWSLTIKLSTR